MVLDVDIVIACSKVDDATGSNCGKKTHERDIASQYSYCDSYYDSVFAVHHRSQLVNLLSQIMMNISSIVGDRLRWMLNTAL